MKDYHLIMTSLVASLKEVYENSPEDVLSKYSGIFSMLHQDNPSPIMKKEFQFYPSKNEVHRWNKKVQLTITEAKIFFLLSKNYKNVVSGEVLYNYLYSNSQDPQDEATIKVIIHKINKKLQVLNVKIHNHWGTGHSLEAGKSSNSLKTNPKESYTIDGVTKTIREWITEINVTYGTFVTRVKKHKWTMEKALTTSTYRPKVSLMNSMHEIAGETKTLRDWCVEYGVRPKIVTNRIFNLGWEAHLALTKPLDKYGIGRWNKNKGTLYVNQ